MNLLEKETKKTKGRATPWALVMTSLILVMVFVVMSGGSSSEGNLRPMARDERVGIEATLDSMSSNEKLQPLIEKLKKQIANNSWWVAKGEEEMVHIEDNRIIFSENFFDMDSFGQESVILPLIGQPLSSLNHSDDELAAIGD